MGFNYGEFEEELDRACTYAGNKYLADFSTDSTYISAGGGKLEAFIDGLQKELDKTTTFYLQKYNAEGDAEARRRALTVAKQCAKKCIEEFSQIQ